MLSGSKNNKGVPDIQTFQQTLFNEHQTLLNTKNLIDFLPQIEQASLAGPLISQLNAFLGANLDERINFDGLKNALQAIKYLCNKKATVEIQMTGSYFCGFCFEQFNNEDVSTELYNQTVQDPKKSQPIPHFTLQCGHSIHLECFKQLIKDFLVKKEFQGCECPNCEIGFGQITEQDLKYFQKIFQ